MAVRSSMWQDSLLEAINDIDIIGGELSWRVSDLYDRQGVTGRQRRALLNLANRAQRLLDDLGAVRSTMGLPERPAG